MTTVPSVRSLRQPEGLADPYSIYEEFRAAEQEGTGIGSVVVSHAEIASVLTDRSMSSERVDGILRPLGDEVRARCPFVDRTLGDIIAFRDPPDHTRLRRLMASTFTPKMMARQRDEIERTADRLVSGIVARGEGDLFTELAFPMPAVVIGRLLGVPDSDLERFQQWALDIVFIVGSGNPTVELAERSHEHFGEMREYLGGLVAARREHPTDDLLSAMVAASDEDDRLTEDEIFANATFLMTAGHETATNMLSNGIVSFLRHPEQLAVLRDQPDLLGAAVDEVLRYESPVQMTPRYALADGEVVGRQVSAGQALLLFLGAANRDPAQFDQPDRFDIARSQERHVAFGLGAHFCLGAALARHELGAVLTTVFGRLGDLQLAIDPSAIEWQPTIDFRGPLSLPVTWTPS